MKVKTPDIKAFLVAIPLLVAGMAVSQNNTIKGFIYDSETSQPVPDVNVILEPAGIGALTSEEGYYLLHRLPEGDFTLKIFCLGYDTLIEMIILSKNMILVRNLEIHPSVYDLGEINVTATREKEARRKVSEIRMIPADIRLTPSLGGMPDIIQHIRTIPGVITRGDIGGQIYIRGGTPVQTKVLLDESVIYNPVHSIGLFSVFDNDYIRDVKMYTGGFDAEYGGCISSVIDVSAKTPNPERWSGKFDVSTIAARMLIEGPVIKDSTFEKSSLSVLLSMKTSYFEQTQDFFYPYLDQELPFYFLDIYGKTTLQIGKNFSLNLSGYQFRDQVSESGTFKSYDWNTSGFGVNLQMMPEQVPILIRTYIAGSVYRMNLREPNYDNRYSRISSVNVGTRFYRYMENHTVKYGIEFLDLRTDYSYFSNIYNKFEQGENSTEIAGFIQYQGNFGWFILDAGFRGAYYATLDQFSPEPRLAVKFLVTENLAFKAAAGMYSQNLISASSDKDIVNFFQGFLSAPVDMVNESGEDPNDFYLQKASHLIAGVSYELFGKVYIDVEGYYKNYTQLINFNKNKLINKSGDPIAPSYMTGDFISETGFADGIDISVKYTGKNRLLEAGYSYAVVRRRYQDPFGETVEYYPQYDRRHNLNISGMYAFGRKRSWVATARWSYGSGFPFTPTAGYYEGITFDEFGNLNHLTGNGEMTILYGPYNSKRLPAYQRLDLSIRKSFIFRNRNTLEAEFNIINVYNQQNIFYINRNTNEESYQLPVLPGLRISYAF